MSPTRRELLIAAGMTGAAVTATGLAGCSNDDSGTGDAASTSTTSTSTTSGVGKLPEAKDAPFDTVVVLMMENRSFDHFLGWMPGTDGKQASLQYADRSGEMHQTYHMAPDWQGCDLQDPFHLWQSMAEHYNNGANDGFLRTQPEGDLFPISYYERDDLPILAALAEGYTLYDHYFCSMLGPTWPNRLYQLCATTDLDITGFYPTGDEPKPVKLDLAIFDRLSEAGLTAGYYTWGEPMTGLFESQRYNDITHPYEKFLEDAEKGDLPNVVFVDPDYTFHSEFNGTSNDFHPYGSIQIGQEFVAEVHDAMADSPQWDDSVFIMNFDESGGFYDHVPPPEVQDDTVLSGPGPFPDLKRLGFRVPAVAMGPFAPKRIETGGPYEHCSILKMIEWRWDLEPMTVRDRTAKNIAETLDFSTTRDPVTLPKFTAEPAKECNNPDHLP